MPINEFLPFTPTDTGTNLMAQADYSVATDRSIGNQPGIASSKLVNKAMRQASFIAAALAQYTANITNQDVLDNGNLSTLVSQLTTAFNANAPTAPTVSKTTASGTGTGGFATATGQQGWLFSVSALSSNLTAGATYTNNGNTFAVLASLSSGATGQVLFCSGTGATSGTTLTLATGSGPATITISQTAPTAPLALYKYTVPTAKTPLYIRVKLVGGGGGGCGVTASNGVVGVTGNSTVFGTLYVLAAGGQGGQFHSAGTRSAGGAINFNVSPWTATNILPLVMQPGASGSGGTWNGSGGPSYAGSGGNSPFGGAGMPPSNDAGTGSPAVANTGSGGGGAYGFNINTGAGDGGASGGYAEFQINQANLQASYLYAVGTGGAGGSTTQSGGAGAAGQIIITEHYQ